MPVAAPVGPVLLLGVVPWRIVHSLLPALVQLQKSASKSQLVLATGSGVVVVVVVTLPGANERASIAISLDQLLPVVPTNRMWVVSAGTCTAASCHCWPWSPTFSQSFVHTSLATLASTNNMPIVAPYIWNLKERTEAADSFKLGLWSENVFDG